MTDTTLGGMLRLARTELAAAGVAGAALDARLLVEHFSGSTRMDAITAPDRPLDAAIVGAIMAAVARRVRGEPVHRILGHREFHGLTLRLSPETLEPRPDTETLVDAMLPFVRQTVAAEGCCRILDLGTGTGAIALALLKEVPDATALGVDISEEALGTAAGNAEAAALSPRFATLRSDWFSNVTGKFHGIVSNPPYICTQELEGLQLEVRLFDPLRALDGGADGLDAYRIIAAGAAPHLEGNGRIAVEIGHRQRDDVTGLFLEAGYRLTEALSDLGGNDRVLVFCPMKHVAAPQK
ncbi:peptide chain release factor N(5)-glutamine methyltransferase [Mesorhizobium sp. L-8-3]|uniref:peptide chain release factor N(5)-glutamine methyltransferase n=1 Tax=Mesorhizobium sp. L-8-3 TaxID=2744522 RepID=UPI00192534FD|nr:peptide chain release factor N(5)-glutamine methyltransferase [Mesorhizobium sp. L-8-3]BCH22761.1 release factor glutamine methyltransferase [Mesorhizobium sp. L-8-3]